ncbi:unnamed protein product [Rotaria socialis]|uniref:Glycosyltransferase family 92 protein n=1 Tax=Rotaria socialis TaxID=392032 RepID=A0A817Y0M6_9BILA|nr:unnamed protein product [Rotaria socialis]CAF4326701.1 unnamed protein product [Rotaria socialis]
MQFTPPTPVPIVVRPEFDAAVKIISQLRSNSTSLHGLQYRSIICTIVRNDPHILEFLLRNLIIGFSHIVIFDNNRILAGYDANINNVLAPFIAAGVVTHIPQGGNTTDLLHNNIKNENSVECLNRYSKKADWVAIFDSDEYFYYENENRAVHALNSLLTDLERNHVCGVKVPWTMMYGEAKILKQNNTLFKAYPRECGIHGLTKIIARPNLTNFNIPHDISCRASADTVKILTGNHNSKISLIHYYSKSMEEFLVKVDQSIPPFIRMPIKTYDLGPVCSLIKFNYSKDYENIFLHSYQQLDAMDSLKPKNFLTAPMLTTKHMADYPLYIYLKYRCAKRHEFDNEKYLATNREAKALVDRGAMVDGLYHFMDNFPKEAIGCWKTEERSFCE